MPARHGFEERARACARAGYRGMCLHLRDYRALRADGHDDAFLAAVLARHGLTENSVEFLVDWFLPGEAGRQAREDEAAAYGAARAYGARVLNVGSDFAGRAIPAEEMRARFRALCGRAAGHGLAIALEIVPWSDVADVDAALGMIAGIPNAGLAVDSWHVFRGGIPLSDVERIPGDRILCVQINDADAGIHGPLAQDTLNRKPCGEGVFNLKAFLASVARTGTKAALSVEIISPQLAAMDVDAAARASIAGVGELLRGIARPAAGQ